MVFLFSFTYIRIIAIVQFVFFIVPFPLKILTEHYQRGQTWIATNFLPVVIGLFHFAISSLCLCVAFRLQLLLNYVRVSASALYYYSAMAVFCCVCFIVSERCLLPQIGSPYAAKHAPLFANLRPMLLALMTSQSIVHQPSTFCAVRQCHIDDATKVSLLLWQSLQAVLKEDAIYRVRFAMPQSVGVIEEEDESGEQRDDEATVAHAFMESAQFLERPIFVEDDSNSGYSEHML
ncbi:hypothetical protein OSTOST_02553 [Ostertagia ostertagi]